MEHPEVLQLLGGEKSRWVKADIGLPLIDGAEQR